MAKKKRSAKGQQEPGAIEMELLKQFLAEHEDVDLDLLKEQISSHLELTHSIVVPPNYERARRLIDEVEDDESEKKRIQAARDAIELCPECTEAYFVLAEFEPTPAKVTELYSVAAEQGRWMLDANPSGDYPRMTYISFRIQMSDHLWSYGQRVDSIEHLMEVKKLDPEDNLWSRYRLAFRLFDLGWDDELQLILEEEGEIRPQVAYAWLKLFVTFRDDKDCPASRELLNECQQLNPFLVEYVMGESSFPISQDIDDFESDDEAEASILANVILPSSKAIPGLARWIRETLDVKRDREPTKEEKDFEQRYIQGLPQSEETWILEERRVDDRWLVFIYSCEEDEPVRIESLDEKPTGAILWEAVIDTMRDPKGDSRRPSKIIVSKSSLAKSWQKRCSRLKIECLQSAETSIPDEVIDQFLDLMTISEGRLEVNASLLETLRELPQLDRIWLTGIFQPPLWINDSATPRRPHVGIVLDQETGLILMQDLTESLEEGFLSHTLLKAMLSPVVDLEAHRPASLRVHPATIPQEYDVVDDIASELDIDCGLSDEEETEILDECLESLIRHVSGPEGRLALLDAEGISEKEIGSLFQSAARFWKMAPWRNVPADRPIELTSPLFDNQVWYAVIVGQLGMNLGLVLYDQREAMEAILAPNGDEVEPDGVFLNFLEKFDIPGIDLWHQEKFGWTIASEEAYPLIERSLPKLQHRRPTREELLALEVALRVIPPFVSHPENEESFCLTVSAFEERDQVHARWI